jgi:hypothetical protein
MARNKNTVVTGDIMPRRGYVDATDDMLLDFERIDAANEGVVTPALEGSIKRMAAMELPAKWIAEQLFLEIEKVEEVIRGRC